jgi:hypothetical protein
MRVSLCADELQFHTDEILIHVEFSLVFCNKILSTMKWPKHDRQLQNKKPYDHNLSIFYINIEFTLRICDLFSSTLVR